MLRRLAFGLPFSKADLKARQPLVTADFLRPLPGDPAPAAGMQNRLVRRLAAWLDPGLRAVFDWPATVALWDDDEPGGLPVRDLYALHDLDPGVPGWVRLYRATPTPEAVELMRPHLENRLVIGFELSPYQVALCEALDLPYVSIAVHPVRFLDDYGFMVSSNVAGADRLARFAIPRDDILFAARLRAAAVRAAADPGPAPGTAVIFGQVDVDASLIGARGLIGLHDCADEIAALCAAHHTVRFKPHPYQAEPARQLAFLRRFGDIRPIGGDPYRLLAAPEVACVAALSSSVLTEAVFFDAPTRALSPLWHDRSEEPVYGREVLTPAFWRAAVGDDSPAAAPRGGAALPGGTTLGAVLGVSWSTGPRPVPEGTGLAPGGTLLLGRDRPGDAACRGDGWFPPADDHRWLGTGPATLALRLPPGLTRPVRITLSVAAMASAEAPVTCRVMAGGQVLAEEHFTGHARRPLSFELPRAVLSPLGDVALALICDRANPPSRVLGLPDRRPLSLAVHAVTAEVPDRPALLLAPGEALRMADLPDADRLGGHGWHPPEEIGIWTMGRKSRFRVALPAPPEEDLELVLTDLRALLTDLLDSNTMVLRVGPHVRRVVRFRKGAPGDLQIGGIDVTLPLPRAAIDPDLQVAVDIELVACHAPLLAELSTDSRDLGVAIGGLRLQSAIAALADRPPEHIASVFGPVNIPTGLGVMARNTIRALDIAHAADPGALSGLGGARAVNLNNSQHPDGSPSLVDPDLGGSGVNIFVGDVTRIERVVRTHGTGILRGRHTICYGAWELETLPTYLADTRYIDEYWALSHFIADAARSRMDVPVRAMPIPVDLHFPAVLAPRARFGIPEEAFTFLFTFSVDSTMARKNPEAVLDAFAMAFPDRTTPVVLVIKSMTRQASAANRADRRRRVVLVEETLSRDENAALYLNADAYVSLHRAEGFGLTMAEAMGYGKPTIGTGYSGNLDFMRPENACLVDYTRVDMDPEAYHNQARQWAEPEVADAARHMLRVFEDIRFRERIARAGKETILTEFSQAAVGARLHARLAEIHAGRPA